MVIIMSIAIDNDVNICYHIHMVESTHVRIDKDTLAKLRAMAPGGNVSAYLRDIANGRSPSLTIYDLAAQVHAFQTTVLKELGVLGKAMRKPEAGG